MPRLLLAIAAGGALGSVARYGVALLAQRAHAGFPYGTLVINVAGSLLLGALVRSFASHSSGPTATQLALTIGLCGGFTTFSTFSLDALRLLQSGEHGRAAAYVAGSVGLSIGAVWLGFLLAARAAR